jgi:hypothetical protein
MFVKKSEYRFDVVEEFAGFPPSLLFDAEIVQFAAGAGKNAGNGGTDAGSAHKICWQHLHVVAVQDRNSVAAHARDIENARDIP